MRIKNIILILLSVFNYSKCMVIHEFFSELFPKYKTTSEYNAYILLKSKPLKKTINYLAVPWQCITIDQAKDALKNLKLNGGFTIIDDDILQQYIPLLQQIGVDTVFANSASIEQFQNIKVISMPFLSMNGVEPNEKKNILYSFVGARTHPIRDKIFNMIHSPESLVIERSAFHYIQPQDVKFKEMIEYKDILSRSRFSLCPRGGGHGSIRFWESLQAGAIPIVISDLYQLPFNFNWKNCIILVKENNIENIFNIISKITPKREKIMRKKCLKAYQLFSGINFVKIIRDYYKE